MSPYKDPADQTRYRREWRARNPEKVREESRRWMASRIEYNREYRAANREKTRAWGLARKLERQPCEVCGATEHIHAHHEDYSKPLEVMWLCAEHHKGVHTA